MMVHVTYREALEDYSNRLHEEMDERDQLRAELDNLKAETVRVLESFAKVWNTKPPFDVTKPFRVSCEIGEYGAWADIAKLHARLTQEQKPEEQNG